MGSLLNNSVVPPGHRDTQAPGRCVSWTKGLTRSAGGPGKGPAGGRHTTGQVLTLHPVGGVFILLGSAILPLSSVTSSPKGPFLQCRGRGKLGHGKNRLFVRADSGTFKRLMGRIFKKFKAEVVLWRPKGQKNEKKNI